ncbi:hypothetical protein AtEden1_Chr2g0226791 [Arabidopsis thaliana]
MRLFNCLDYEEFQYVRLLDQESFLRSTSTYLFCFTVGISCFQLLWFFGKVVC